MTVLVVPEGALMQGLATDTEASKRHHSVADFRRHFAGILRQPGLAGFGDCVVTQTGVADGHVHVSTGGIWIKGSQAAQQGNYMIYNDGDADINVLGPNPAHATLPRVDAIVGQVTDAFYSGSDGEFIVPITGTPNASPVLPTLPANSYPIAYILIPAASATITTANISNVGVPAARDSSPTKLFETLLGSAAASVVFPKQLPSPAPAMTLPNYFRELEIVYQSRGDNASKNVDVRMQANGDTAVNYADQVLFGNNNATASAQPAALTANARVGRITAATGTANYGSVGVVRIPNYALTTFAKNAIGQSTNFDTIALVDSFLLNWGWVWNSTAAMTWLTLFPSAGNFITGSLFTIKGIF